MVEEKRTCFYLKNVGCLLIHEKMCVKTLKCFSERPTKTTRIESCSRRRVVDEPQNFATKDWDIHAYPAILNEYVEEWSPCGVGQSGPSAKSSNGNCKSHRPARLLGLSSVFSIKLL